MSDMHGFDRIVFGAIALVMIGIAGAICVFALLAPAAR